jgi:hypothetical protein
MLLDNARLMLREIRNAFLSCEKFWVLETLALIVLQLYIHKDLLAIKRFD